MENIDWIFLPNNDVDNFPQDQLQFGFILYIRRPGSQTATEVNAQSYGSVNANGDNNWKYTKIWVRNRYDSDYYTNNFVRPYTRWGGLTTSYTGFVRNYDWNTHGLQVREHEPDAFVEGVHYQILSGTQPHANGGTVQVTYLATMSGVPINYTGNSEELNFYVSSSFWIERGGNVGTVSGREVTEWHLWREYASGIGSRWILIKSINQGNNPTYEGLEWAILPDCEPGTTWVPECGECICDVIIDGTLAGIINSIVL